MDGVQFGMRSHTSRIREVASEQRCSTALRCGAPGLFGPVVRGTSRIRRETCLILVIPVSPSRCEMPKIRERTRQSHGHSGFLRCIEMTPRRLAHGSRCECHVRQVGRTGDVGSFNTTCCVHSPDEPCPMPTARRGQRRYSPAQHEGACHRGQLGAGNDDEQPEDGQA